MSSLCLSQEIKRELAKADDVLTLGSSARMHAEFHFELIYQTEKH